MKKTAIADITIKQAGKNSGYTLSFREKLEVAKLLEKLNVDVIELGQLQNVKADVLLIKSICSSVKNSIVAVPVGLDEKEPEVVWSALKEANKPRFQVQLPVSDAQMEYIAGKKPAAMLEIIKDRVKACKQYCNDVEFMAVDATRSNFEFLCDAISAAIENGAVVITICDTAGVMLADEITVFIKNLYAALPVLKDVTLGVEIANTISLSDACSVSAVMSGASLVKTSVGNNDTASLSNVVGIISAKADVIGAECNVKTTQLKRVTEQIDWICKDNSSTHTVDNGSSDDDMQLCVHDNMEAVIKAVSILGYDLTDEDNTKVYEEFSKIAAKKEKVGASELDAIVASVALQVPPTYRLESYLINTGNAINASSHMRLVKNGEIIEGISLGDGPIDAAFLAIEQIVGQYFELDDFQIKSITEGREAMGEAVVKLRNNGKLYSGRGISTDIVGASINAYINAINKIVYEESEN